MDAIWSQRSKCRLGMDGAALRPPSAIIVGRARPLAIRRREGGVRPGKLDADKKRESAKNPAAVKDTEGIAGGRSRA